jgi:hypothetical protein
MEASKTKLSEAERARAEALDSTDDHEQLSDDENALIDRYHAEVTEEFFDACRTERSAGA